MKNYSTKATQHYLAIYMDILENYTGDEIYQELEHLDRIASNCLTFAEFTDYHQQTSNYIKNIGA
jgi:hypothetical protein